MTRFLVVFDVDSTLIQDEVIELLADAAGVREQVAAITESAMRGELDFESSLRERVSTLNGLPESVIHQTYQRIRLTEGAEQLIAGIHQRGGKAGAVSGGFSQVLEPLAKRLNLDYQRANELEIVDGVLTGKVLGPVIDAQAKAEALSQWAADCGVGVIHSLAVGDGANDLKMMNLAGLSIAFNAKPKVKDEAQLVSCLVDLRQLLHVLP